jgi:hypothetical protein
VADRAIAALAADPVTLEELERACRRYYEKAMPSDRYLVNLRRGASCAEPYDAGLIVIDLIARLVHVDSTYSSPGPVGEVEYHNGKCCTNTALRYHLADDWLFTREAEAWEVLPEQRRREQAARPQFDAREIFYGRPLVEFIARESFAAFVKRKTADLTVAPEGVSELHREFEAETDSLGDFDSSADARSLEGDSADFPRRENESPEIAFARDSIRQIHANWLMTPRADLADRCPRELAIAQVGHLDWDLQDQSERWSALGKCPPGLDPASFAFRFGGFGTHELVKYYDLVRELLRSCWDRLAELERARPAGKGLENFSVGDFLTDEIPPLEMLRDIWMQTPDPECHGRTPRSIIDRERARLPEAMSGREAIHDPDCPCCQMLADMPGLMFWHLDGCEMDDEFAFDMRHLTRESWDAKRREWDEYNRRFNAEWKERERLGVTNSRGGADGEKSVWSSSFVVSEESDVPLGIRLFGIGCRLAEVITDLRGDAENGPADLEARQFIDQLNRDFGNVREVLQSSDESVAEALIQPVLSRFTDTLAAVAAARVELAPKCESLTTSLAKFLEPEPELPDGPPYAFGDDELPF